MAQVCIACALVSACATAPREDADSISRNAGADMDTEICEILEHASVKYGIPGLAAAFVDDTGLKSMGVYGVRRVGSSSPVTMDDRWLLGSDTKAITATVVAALVEKKLLTWNTTVVDVFPEYGKQIHKGYQGLTITRLLSHTGGLPRDSYNLRIVLEDRFNPDNDPVEMRKKILKNALSRPPEKKAGSSFVYSNAGYVIAGAMIEKITGVPYEENVRNLVFKPLGMNDSGFGGLGTPGLVDQPWGHNKNGKPDTINGPHSDFIPSVGLAMTAYSPAGRVNSTFQDWSKYIADILGHYTGKDTLLRPESYETLLAPVQNGGYTLGWGYEKSSVPGNDALRHDGSNGHYYARAVVYPAKNTAILITANQGVSFPKITNAFFEIERNMRLLHEKRTH